MTQQKQIFENLLKQIGFEHSTTGAESFWKISSTSPNNMIKTKLSILQRKDRFTLDKCHISIDLNKALQTLETTSRKRFQRVVSSSAKITASGGMQLILEVLPTRADSRTETQDEKRADASDCGTIIGWTTTVTHSGSHLLLQITDAFSIGQPIADWWCALIKIATESLTPGLSGYWETQNLFEYSLPIWLLPNHSDSFDNESHAAIKSVTSVILRTPRPIFSTVKSNKLTYELAAPDSTNDPENPIEILEARETAQYWRLADQKILSKSKLQLAPDVKEQSPNAVLSRLGAYPQLLGQVQFVLDKNHNVESNSCLISLTGFLILLEFQGRSHDLIKATSDMLRQIARTFGDLHQHAPLRNILPEILGDRWSKVDPEKAILSWKTSLTAKPQNLRILHKISALAREIGDQSLEFQILIELCQKERRANQLKLSALRLIEIDATGQITDDNLRGQFQNVLEIAARKTAFSTKIVMTLSDLFRINGEHRKALSFLESCLKTDKENINPTELAELHAAIGTIWKRHENNLALATNRFIAATTPPSKPTDKVLDDAENFFLETNNNEQLKRLFMIRANQADNRDSFDVVERSAKYMNKMGHHKEAILAVLKLMSMNRFQQWYLDVISDATDADDINWTALTTKMHAADSRQLPKDALPMWKLVTGRCALKQKSTNEVAIQNLSNHDVIPLLSSFEAKSVLSIIQRNGNKNQLTSFISRRLNFASELEKQELVSIIVENDLESESDEFEMTIAILAKQLNDLKASCERQQKSLNSKNNPRLLKAIEVHKKVLFKDPLLVEFLDKSIDFIQTAEDQNNEMILSGVIEQREQLKNFSDSEREKLIASLLERKFLTIALEQVNKSMEKGLLGTQKPTAIETLFERAPERKAAWYYLASKSNKSAAEKLAYQKLALHNFLLTDTKAEEVIQIIREIGESEILTFEILTTLESICSEKRHHNEFYTVIKRQIEKNQSQRSDLIYWCIRYVNSRLMDRELAASTFAKWSYSLPESSTHKNLSQGWLWLAARNNLEAQRAFTSVLKEPEILECQDVCFSAIDGFAQTKPQKTQFAAIIQTLISWAENSSSSLLVAGLIAKSIHYEIADNEHLRDAFLKTFETAPVNYVASIAIQALSKAERSPNGVLKLIEEWKTLKIVSSNPKRWSELVGCLTNDHFLRQLRRQSRCEILYMHAKNLFDDEQRRFDAIPHFEVITIENPMDARVWIPLFSLYEEGNAKQKLVSHLERIIPLLERDSSLLEKTPFNIESLKSSLRRARKSVLDSRNLNSPDAPPSANQKASRFDLNDHAARLQRGWVEAIPVVRISAVSASSKSAAGDGNDMSTQSGSSELQQPITHFDGAAAPNLLTSEVQLETQVEPKEKSDQTRSQTDLKLLKDSITSSAPTPLNWRELVASGEIPPGLTKKIVNMAFASEIEKHIAVQCISLLAGETKDLSGWHWPVWRANDSFQYPTSATGRMPKDLELKHYGGQLHRLIKIICPIILRANRSKFMANSYLQRLGLPQNTKSVQVQTSHPAIKRGAIWFFGSRLTSSKIKFFDTPGLGADVFFDISQRAIHFDAKWQLGLPPTVLAYRVLENLIYLKKGVPGIPFLEAETEIIPVIQDIRNVLSSNGVARLRIAFGIDHADISSQLRSMNKEQLVSLLGWVNDKSLDGMKTLQLEMRIKAFSELFGSTLDLIGTCESIVGQDFCDPTKLQPGKIRGIHPIIEHLLQLATKLTI